MATKTKNAFLDFLTFTGTLKKKGVRHALLLLLASARRQKELERLYTSMLPTNCHLSRHHKQLMDEAFREMQESEHVRENLLKLLFEMVREGETMLDQYVDRLYVGRKQLDLSRIGVGVERVIFGQPDGEGHREIHFLATLFGVEIKMACQRTIDGAILVSLIINDKDEANRILTEEVVHQLSSLPESETHGGMRIATSGMTALDFSWYTPEDGLLNLAELVRVRKDGEYAPKLWVATDAFLEELMRRLNAMGIPITFIRRRNPHTDCACPQGCRHHQRELLTAVRHYEKGGLSKKDIAGANQWKVHCTKCEECHRWQSSEGCVFSHLVQGIIEIGERDQH